ncbi:MAG: DinB family protein [Anaerolineae bacterium]|nr:DinB family protein [Anaerolineae bacterium]
MNDAAHFKTQLDDARAQMRAALDGIDELMPVYEGWTIKHILAHIAGWDDATTASLRAHISGNEPGTPAARGIDYYNAQSVAEREPLPFPHIVKEWELAREQLKATLDALPEAKFTEKFVFPWGPMGTVDQIIGIMVHHEIEHAQEIEVLKKQAKSEPEAEADKSEPDDSAAGSMAADNVTVADNAESDDTKANDTGSA